MSKRTLTLTAAIVLNGEIQPRGTKIEVNEELARSLINRGRVEETSEVLAVEHETEAVNIGKMKKAELVELATEYGIENPEDNTVDELRILIQAAAEQ